MELHLAIKNILKYQGEDFLLDPKMINALIDFQAYDQHPALKNIFRTLHQDGYIKKVKDAGKWDASCDQIVYEIERDYAFPHDLVELLLKSVAVGLGYKCQLPTSAQPNQPQRKSQSHTPPSGKPWSKLSVDEREAILNSLVEIRPSSCGLTFDSVYIADATSEFDKNVCFNINYEMSGKLPKDRYVNLEYAIYDKSNRLRKNNLLTSTLGDMKSRSYNMIDSDYVELNFKYTDLGKILIFIDD